MTALRNYLLVLALLPELMLLPCLERAQTQQGESVTAAATSSPSVDKKRPGQSPPGVVTYKEKVNLVVVPVVVRDKKGKTVGSLKREDFRIFDDGKLQTISTFDMETNSVSERGPRGSVLDKALPDNILGSRPQHFFAYLFDDVHLKAGDLMQVRGAAEKHLASGMGAQERAAVFTTSGDVTTEFTGDMAELRQAMNRIKPGFSAGGTQCPYMNYYLAQRVINESGSGARYGTGATPVWDAATLDASHCTPGMHVARERALDAARREKQIGDANTRRSLLAVQLAVRRLAAMPGTRTLILVSPGFLTGNDHAEQDTIIDLATKDKVVVNALDARGLYTGIVGADNEGGPSNSEAAQIESPYNRQALVVQSDIMAELAYGTGGEFFRDSNDLSGGFDQLAAPPQYIYELGFSPTDLNHPGRYHHLRVVLVDRHGWSLQARRGYSEGTGASTAGEQASEVLERALFSRDQVHNFPVSLSMGYTTDAGAHRELSVTTHIDVDEIALRRVNDTSLDSLTLVCGLFDINGNYLQGKKMEVALHLHDYVLKQVANGMNIKTTFDVSPGAYLIRVVVRDAGTGLLSTANGSGIVQ